MNIGCHHLPFFVDGAVAQADSLDWFHHDIKGKKIVVKTISRASIPAVYISTPLLLEHTPGFSKSQGVVTMFLVARPLNLRNPFVKGRKAESSGLALGGIAFFVVLVHLQGTEGGST